MASALIRRRAANLTADSARRARTAAASPATTARLNQNHFACSSSGTPTSTLAHNKLSSYRTGRVWALRNVVMSASFASAGHFCDACGAPTTSQVPEGDNRERRVCTSKQCKKIHYVNPKAVVGCLVECITGGDKGGDEPRRQVLLCKRAINPCRGLWTLPAGFQECGESTSEGAARETYEEANAVVSGRLSPYAHLDIPAISQTYIFFRATLASPDGHSPGTESLETKLFDVDDIPFNQIAFSSVKIVLDCYLQDLKKGSYSYHHGTILKQPEVSADSPDFVLSNYTCLSTDHKLHKL